MAFTPPAHTPYQWQNAPATGTPLDAAHLMAAETDAIAYTQSVIGLYDTYASLIRTAVKTANYTAAPGDNVPADISASSWTLQLPAAPVDRTRIAIKIINISGTPGSTSLTIARGGTTDVFNKAGGNTSIVLTALYQGVILQYDSATAIWTVQSTDTPLGTALGAAQLGTDGKVGGPSGSAMSNSVVIGKTANGATDGTSINAAFTAGVTVRLVPGSTYVLDTAIVIPSNCTLDISGAILTRGTGYTAGPLIMNAAGNPQRTVTDAAITSGQSQLTSATAAFTSADLGQQVQIVGAGATVSGSNVPFYATIGTVTNGTTVQLVRSTTDSTAVTAANTVTGATCRIYRRDSGIGIVGNAQTFVQGGDNRASDGTAANPVGGLRAVILLRRIDRLSIDGGWMQLNNTTATSGTAVLFRIGDVTDLDVRRLRSAQNPTITGSDLVHLNGPISNFTLSDLEGIASDDFVSICTADWPQYNEMAGDIRDGLIANVYAQSGVAHAVALFGGQYTNGGGNALMKNVTINHIRGVSTSTELVGISDVGGGTPGGLIVSGLTIRDVKGSAPALKPLIALTANLVHDAVLEDLDWTGNGGSAGVTQSTQQPIVSVGTSGQSLTIRRVAMDKDINYVDVVQFYGGRFQKVLVDDVNIAGTNVNQFGMNLVAYWGGGGPGRLTLRNCRAFFDGSQQNAFVLVSTQWTVQELVIDDFEINNATALVLNLGTAGLYGGVVNPTISISNGYVNNVPYLCSLGITAQVKLRAIDYSGTGGSLLVRNQNTGAIRVTAANDISATGMATSWLQNNGGGTISCNGPLSVDQTILTPQDGDIIYNSNATPLNGVGLAIRSSSAAKWKNIYSGVTN